MKKKTGREAWTLHLPAAVKNDCQYFITGREKMTTNKITDFSDRRAIRGSLEHLDQERRENRLQKHIYQNIIETLKAILPEDLYEDFRLQEERE